MPVSELRKALTTVTGTGSNLVQEDIEREIRRDLMVKSPLFNFLPLVPATGTTHTVVKRTARNTAGRWEGEMTEPSYGNSTYGRRNVTVKILRNAGQVSDFQQSAALSFADSVALEIESASDDFRELLEFSAMYGCANAEVHSFTGDAYQYNGLYPFILNDDSTNCILDKRGAKITLSSLDDVLNVTKDKYRNLQGGRWFWLMSPQMQSTITGLQTLVERQVPTIEFEGGFSMASYMGVPIIQTGFTAPTSVSASVSGLGATAHGTGTVTAATYRYRIAAFTLYGEQVTSTAAAVTHTGAEAHTDLSWTANSSAKLYAIYRTGADEADTVSNYDLLDIIAAKAYDSTGAATGNVTTYEDGFTKTAITSVHPLAAYDSTSKAMETIWLVLLDQMQGMSLAVLPPTKGDSYGGDPTRNLVRYDEIPVSTDSYAFRLKSYQCLQIPDAKVCAVIRGAQRNATA